MILLFNVSEEASFALYMRPNKLFHYLSFLSLPPV
jgi:hypothetical protein